jgi:hypothetical protein
MRRSDIIASAKGTLRSLVANPTSAGMENFERLHWLYV